MKGSKDPYTHIFSGKTLSGIEIFIRGTDPQNHYRMGLHRLSFTLGAFLERHGLSGNLLADTAAKLRQAKDDPQHYGDNSPNWFHDDPDRTLIAPDLRFSFWDLYQYGTTGPDGFEGFKRLTSIDTSLDEATLTGVVGLLLLDSAVNLLCQGDFYRSAAAAMEGAACLEQMVLDGSYSSIAQSARSALARKAGQARHAKKHDAKRQVLEKWDAGVFGGNKTSAGNWAHDNFEVSVEVARKWVRKHEAEKK